MGSAASQLRGQPDAAQLASMLSNAASLHLPGSEVTPSVQQTAPQAAMQPDVAQLASMLNSAAPPQPQAPEPQAVVQQTTPQQAATQPVAAQPASILSNAAPPHPQPHHPQLAAQQAAAELPWGGPTVAQLTSKLQLVKRSLEQRRQNQADEQTARQLAATQSHLRQLASMPGNAVAPHLQAPQPQPSMQQTASQQTPMLHDASVPHPSAAQAQPVLQHTALQQAVDLTQEPQSQAHAAAAQSGAGQPQQQPPGVRPAARVPKVERQSGGSHWRTQVCCAGPLASLFLTSNRNSCMLRDNAHTSLQS
jgi:hypothetical protein